MAGSRVSPAYLADGTVAAHGDQTAVAGLERVPGQVAAGPGGVGKRDSDWAKHGLQALGQMGPGAAVAAANGVDDGEGYGLWGYWQLLQGCAASTMYRTNTRSYKHRAINSSLPLGPRHKIVVDLLYAIGGSGFDIHAQDWFGAAGAHQHPGIFSHLEFVAVATVDVAHPAAA